MSGAAEKQLPGQLVRYLINGLVATAIHYSVLRFNMQVLDMHSAGVANGIAAIFGITVSFIGSRYFVFRAAQGKLGRQGLLFVATYGCIALLHAGILYLWTDVYALDYTLGFLVATCMQVSVSFIANKFMVFK
ncbi:GtrA family protein [Xanthomonas sacchari]|uniref:GtrA family protein n=1 Tax=Xanthomonas sacchari TaxID=56458 RepID=UPI0005823826|nr:GtrA family protein [Xanthomonas sacchari]AJC46008.1 polysaccharide biosynthesis protein GtrA [Xanthomonas sacchari]